MKDEGLKSESISTSLGAIEIIVNPDMPDGMGLMLNTREIARLKRDYGERWMEHIEAAVFKLQTELHA